jgi:NADPH-dependent F420 reductase
LGLARRLALGGVPVVLGSRSAERAEAAAAPLAAEGLPVSGAANAEAAGADLVIVAVPYDGHRELLEALAPLLAGKVVVDCVNPLGFDKQGAYLLEVEAGSAALEAAAALPDSTVVAAFHHVSAVQLADPDVAEIDMDILVLGDSRPATDLVQGLVGRIAGMRGIYAGRLRNAQQVEGLTANLISVNRRYKAHAGVRITDV